MLEIQNRQALCGESKVRVTGKNAFVGMSGFVEPPLFFPGYGQEHESRQIVWLILQDGFCLRLSLLVIAGFLEKFQQGKKFATCFCRRKVRVRLQRGPHGRLSILHPGSREVSQREVVKNRRMARLPEIAFLE